MQQEDNSMLFFNQIDESFNFDIPEFNPPTIKQETTEVQKEFMDNIEWENFTNNQNESSLFLENLFNTEGNIFESRNNEIYPNIKQECGSFDSTTNLTTPKNKLEEEMHMEKVPKTKKTKTEPLEINTSISETPKKKSKKLMTPEELENKKKDQLQKRLIKNRRTAEISRKRKKAKKYTLEESLQQLKDQAIQLDKQSIEVSCENRVLKTEYYALLSLILSIPALAKKFDKISEIVVDQKDKKIFNLEQTGQFASVYLFNIIYSIHQQWVQMKQTISSHGLPQNIENQSQTSLQDVIVN
eukprot:TRINITY_DN3692_c0_g1_i1.p1 TRINITY_DN3692_c0_g1~~TRINITY_DN3692_c0_g1_i1.p1  ORF type:complete len:299 (-),score=84.49 TRINITY_DN3692_c0_g1_i1:69-965(-)